MFCFQCQETAKGTGCTTRGVCGKLPETSLYMDILLSIVKTMGTLMEKRMKTMPTDSCDKDKKCCERTQTIESDDTSTGRRR